MSFIFKSKMDKFFVKIAKKLLRWNITFSPVEYILFCSFFCEILHLELLKADGVSLSAFKSENQHEKYFFIIQIFKGDLSFA